MVLALHQDDEIFRSRWDNQFTYGNSNAKRDYHYEKWGEYAIYTRENFLIDLQTAIQEYSPTDIYVPSRYDMHFEHAYLGLFATEVIRNIQSENPSYNPTLHESIIHSKAVDGVRDGAAMGLPHGHPRYPHAEWVSNDENVGGWISLDFGIKKNISKIVLYDRPSEDNQIISGKLIFDDGSEIKVGELPNNERPLEIEIAKNSVSVKFVVTGVSDSTEVADLAEIEVY